MGTVFKTITRFNHLDHEGINGRKVRRLPPLFLLASVLLAGCALVDEDTSDCPSAETGSSSAAISFDSSVGQSTWTAGTRTAQGTIDGLDGLKSSAGFGVFAANTGSHEYVSSSVIPDFMYNQQVEWGAAHGVWTYEPLKYWPNDNDGRESYLHFFAYAPYSKADGSDNASKCITAFSNNFDSGDPWLIYQLGGTRDDWKSSQVDLLYAFTKDQQKKPVLSQKISMRFRHALAGAGDAVTVGCSDILKNRMKTIARGVSKEVALYIDKLTLNYTLLRKGRLVLNSSGTPNWQHIESEDATVHRVTVFEPAGGFLIGYTSSDGGSFYSGSSSFSTDQGIFYIPLDVTGISQSVNVSAEYRVTLDGEDSYSGVIGTTVVLDGTAGSSQNLSLTFNNNLPLSGSEDLSVGLRILDIPDQTFTADDEGNAVARQPAVTVVSNDGLVLTQGTDYTLMYSNNTNAGTASITATGINDYQGGVATKTFVIQKAVGSISFTIPVVTLARGVSDEAHKVTKGGDGTVVYSSSATGVATVDAEGKVTAVAAGTCVITATVSDGTNYTYPVKTASYVLTVTE